MAVEGSSLFRQSAGSPLYLFMAKVHAWVLDFMMTIYC